MIRIYYVCFKWSVSPSKQVCSGLIWWRSGVDEIWEINWNIGVGVVLEMLTTIFLWCWFSRIGRWLWLVRFCSEKYVGAFSWFRFFSHSICTFWDVFFYDPRVDSFVFSWGFLVLPFILLCKSFFLIQSFVSD